jgi:hypothetical protein
MGEISELGIARFEIWDRHGRDWHGMDAIRFGTGMHSDRFGTGMNLGQAWNQLHIEARDAAGRD